MQFYQDIAFILDLSHPLLLLFGCHCPIEIICSVYLYLKWNKLEIIVHGLSYLVFKICKLVEN